MMDKKGLIEFVQSLPDDLEVLPLEPEAQDRFNYGWESQNKFTDLGGVHQCDVHNTLTVRIVFRTRYHGEFRREYNDPDGAFYNIHRIK